MTAKMHQNFNRVLCLQYKHRVKKSKEFVVKKKSYARLKFRKIVVFVSKWLRYIYISVSRGHIFSKSHPCSSDHNFGSIKDTDLINTAIDRYLLDLSNNVLLKCLVTFQ